MADEKRMLEGQRATIQEHIGKYNEYDADARNMALRTIRNAQEQIKKLLNRHPHWGSSWEDTWTP